MNTQHLRYVVEIDRMRSISQAAAQHSSPKTIPT